jgi:peptidoglycan/xylan/chitin deacetylase (PgdA/CDA1 family)
LTGTSASTTGLTTVKAAILTYHSQNVAGHETGNNDHLALAADLDAMHAGGVRFVSLATLVAGLFDGKGLPPSELLVCLTFDDGCDFDVKTLEFPGFGVQRGFLPVMEDFVRRHGDEAQPGLHATSFVIASPKAREVIDRKSLFGRGHMGDDWWKAAEEHRMITIGNHGWDHNHPDLEDAGYPRGGFEAIDTYELCHQQVTDAADYIESVIGRYPVFFAYPFGESSDYIRETWFPEERRLHLCEAVVGTEPGWITPESNRWNLPRFVCGRDWASPGELMEILFAEPGGTSAEAVAVEVE